MINPFIVNAAAKIKTRTWYNDHTGAIIALAALLNDSKAKKAIYDIDTEHTRAGHLSEAQQKKRKAIYTALMKKAAKKYTAENYNILKSAF